MGTSEEQAIVSESVIVPIEHFSGSHRVQSWADVAFRGRLIEDHVKAELLLAVSQQGAVSVDEIAVEWECHASLNGATIPREIYDGHGIEGEPPEIAVAEVERRVQQFTNAARRAWAEGTGPVRVDIQPIVANVGAHAKRLDEDLIGPPPSDQTIQDILTLVNAEFARALPTVEEISTWDEATRDSVLEWASAVHLTASDNEGIKIPPLPEVLRKVITS